MQDLFEAQPPAYQPLADRMRPHHISQVVGQTHLLSAQKPLRLAIEQGKLHSMLLWGPPGTGKTTLARLIAHHGEAQFLSLSAVLSGVKEIRQAIDRARQHSGISVLFVDEVHRFNKSQQDAFLPHIEDGTVIFVGATTENPSFELNNALLSRTRTYVLKALSEVDLMTLIESALSDEERGLGALNLHMDEDTRHLLARSADGDARRVLSYLEIVSDLAEQGEITRMAVEDVVGQGLRRFDKQGDLFYEQISALHKSVRGSDPDASLYWFCRMIDGGCDPVYIARRITRMASEDIGNADPRALSITLDAWDVYTRLGSPEGELALAQAIVYMACAAKSNAVYSAYNQASRDAATTGSLDVPMHLRNAPTSLMKDMGYGDTYRYAHDEVDAFAAGEQYFPDQMGEKIYYHPVDRGLESRISEKLNHLRELNRKARDTS